jgi:hypothetical protein
MARRLPDAAADAIFRLTRRANQWFMRCWSNNREGTSLMSEQFYTSSELVEISKLNGSFRRNYGTFIGAYLYSAPRVAGHSFGLV